jgi:hypothetical protein
MAVPTLLPVLPWQHCRQRTLPLAPNSIWRYNRATTLRNVSTMVLGRASLSRIDREGVQLGEIGSRWHVLAVQSP